jgi:hypothetical protein
VDSTVLRGKFDIVFIGGSDSSCDALGDLTAQVIERSFVKFHQAGGKLVFLHDSGYENKWNYFRSQMGPNKIIHGWERPLWTEVRRKSPAEERSVILRAPFEIPDPFSVALTHSGQMSSPNALLIGTQSEDTYYIERNGIAFCETGHTSWSVTKHEWRFLVNMTYHLTESGKHRPSST